MGLLVVLEATIEEADRRTARVQRQAA